MSSVALVTRIVLIVAMVVTIGLIGSTRRLGFAATLFLSILLTPIGGLLVALLSGPRRRKPRRRSKTKDG